MLAFPDLDIKQLQSAVGAALRNWYTVGGTKENQLAFLLIVQQEQNNQPDLSPSSLRLATNTLVKGAMTELEAENPEGMRILRLRFWDGLQIGEVAGELDISTDMVSHWQRKAIAQVAHLLLTWEEVAWADEAEEIAARLPPASVKLFGVDKPLANLMTELLKWGDPWITAVVGIGGIGKTSLALRVARQIVKEFRFENVIWTKLDSGSMRATLGSPELLRDRLLVAISKQLWPNSFGETTPTQRLKQVRHALKTKRILVVIDNLESVEDTAVLLDYVRDWCDPSKFLLTSRIRPSDAFLVPLDQLSRSAASELVRYYLQRQNKVGARSLTERDLDGIYEHTGGNPLALKLVVNLLDGLSLSTVLNGLLTVNTDKVEELYRHIYWQNWQLIGEAARILLQAMVLVTADGAELDYLQTLSGLEERPLQSAIMELRHRSLLDASDDLHTRRYTIHPLTKSFLQTEIIHWPLAANMDIELAAE